MVYKRAILTTKTVFAALAALQMKIRRRELEKVSTKKQEKIRAIQTLQ